MAQQTIFGPPRPNAPFNTGDSTELGDQPQVVVQKVNAMFTDLYTINSEIGMTTVNFGTFPGAQDTLTVISGQTGLASGMSVNAQVIATATADHSADEHWVDPPILTVGTIIPGTGFTIYGISRDGGTLFGNYTVQWQWY